VSRQKDDPDQLKIKQKKGTWKRFIRLFSKCHLPWVWLIVYVVLSLGLVNIGLSETDYTASLFAGDTSPALLAKLIGVMVLNLVGSYFVIFARAVTSARTDRNMREQLFNKVTRLPMTYFQDEEPREAVYRIVSNATVISNTLIFVLVPLMTAGYSAVSIIRKVFKYDLRLSLILIGFIPIQVLIAFLFGRLNYSLSERDASVQAGLMQRLAELVTNIPLAKAFAKEDKETERGQELTSRACKLNIKASWLSQFKDLSETVVSLVQAVFIVFVGVLLLRNEEITKRAWIAFFLFSSVFTSAVSEFMMYWNNLKNIQGSADKVGEIMNAPEEETEGEACENLTGDIRVRSLQFGYTEEHTVFSDVTCEFKDNCVTALLGASGCGKTTMANLLTRLYRPSAGEITIQGKNISDYALADYRKQFVMVSQNSMLFSGTIRENVCYGNEAISEEALTEALKMSGSYDFVQKLPDGVDTVLEEYGSNLSGGQRQRLAIARALLSKAHYMILDEPTASMDTLAVNELIHILEQTAENRCMIIIAHSAAVLPIANRVVVVEDGRISAEGEVDVVAKRSPFLRQLMGKQVVQ
jgi:ATP-binding cassette subfamily B protein AbcA/BmrA